MFIPASFAETYDKLGISFNYPDDWILEEQFISTERLPDKLDFRDQDSYYRLNIEYSIISDDLGNLLKNDKYIEQLMDDLKLECSEKDTCQNRIVSYDSDNDNNIGQIVFETVYVGEYGAIVEKSSSLFFDKIIWKVRYSASEEFFPNYEFFFDSVNQSIMLYEDQKFIEVVYQNNDNVPNQIKNQNQFPNNSLGSTLGTIFGVVIIIVVIVFFIKWRLDVWLGRDN